MGEVGLRLLEAVKGPEPPGHYLTAALSLFKWHIRWIHCLDADVGGEADG